MYPKSIHSLIQAFMKLPSVGPRTAERFVFHLLRSGKKEVAELTLALKNLMETVKSCDVCWDFSDQTPCAICRDKSRDAATLAVVALSHDVQAIERVKSYRGRYHVLRGVIRPDEEDSMQNLKITELFDRVQHEPITEVILAFNPDMDGETTMMFLEKKLHALKPTLHVSRLARGLPMGSDIRYADDITLESALKHRTS